MSIRASSPFPIYMDNDGTPLSQGYVYFGVSGANPETTPQAVYWDEALTIPAAQPIRTLNGFFVRNGTPANVFLAAVYSVVVRNKNRVLLYSSLVNPGISVSTAMVPVMSAATLAVARDALGVSKKIKGYQAISLTHFTDTLEPSITAGSEIEVGATFYEFAIDEAAVAGGWAAIGVSTMVYMYVVPAGALHTWIYSATAPTWDVAKQGWYNGNNRAFGGLYKDAGGNYTAKWIYINAGGVQAMEYANSGVIFLTTGSSPYTCLHSGGLTAIINATTNPYVFNLPVALGLGHEIDIVDASILATGLVKITPNGADAMGSAGNVSCYLQNVDQSGFVYSFQHLRLRDSRVGYWEVIGGQFCPHQTVDTDGAHAHLGKLHLLPLKNATDRNLFNGVPPAVGNFTAAITAWATKGIPAGAKGVRVEIQLTVYCTGAGGFSLTCDLSDNNTNGGSLGTAHPSLDLVFPTGAAGQTFKVCLIADISLDASGRFYGHTSGAGNVTLANSTLYITALGYYMGD